MIRPLAAAAALLTVAPSPGLTQQADSRPDWWRDAVCYEIFVRSFFDSDGDGVGDLRGLTGKLPYLKDLGVNCLWLMPVAQSPSYHGYDVTNYYQINRDYGSNEDFRRLMAEAHAAGNPGGGRPRPQPHVLGAPVLQVGAARSGVALAGLVPLVTDRAQVEGVVGRRPGTRRPTGTSTTTVSSGRGCPTSTWPIRR